MIRILLVAVLAALGAAGPSAAQLTLLGAGPGASGSSAPFTQKGFVVGGGYAFNQNSAGQMLMLGESVFLGN
jgi:hypothetical protein